MAILHSNDTWNLVPLSSGKQIFDCHWVCAVKIGPDGHMMTPFSLLAKITPARLSLAMVTIHHWPLRQLDIKNAFLHGELQEV